MVVIISVLVVLFIVLVLTYNNLIGKKNQIENAEGSIDACLKQRFDLIPSLVEVAKQYMQHEEKILSKIVELRQNGQKAHDIHDKIETDKELSKEMRGLMLNVENYPTLLSNTHFLEIQKSLNSVEKDIAASRRFFNTAVTNFNNAIESFPGLLLAPGLKLSKKETFSIDESERKNPDIKKLFKQS